MEHEQRQQVQPCPTVTKLEVGRDQPRHRKLPVNRGDAVGMKTFGTRLQRRGRWFEPSTAHKTKEQLNTATWPKVTT